MRGGATGRFFLVRYAGLDFTLSAVKKLEPVVKIPKSRTRAGGASAE